MAIKTAQVCFRKGDKKVLRKFKNSGVIPIISYIHFEEKSLRYISNNPIDKNLVTLFFIHGAPGSSSNYFRFLKDRELGEKANLIAVDRLGYGYSDHGNPEPSIEKQADSIFSIIKKYKLKKVITIGWSYGVPIAAKMAYKYSEIKYNLFIAGAISPQHERFFLIAKMIDWKLTKWMVQKPFLVANDEKLTHVSELIKMENDWAKITSPIIYIHGTKDHVVPFENMKYIKRKVSEKLLKAITLKGANHFILKKYYSLIKKELLQAMRVIN